MTKLPYFVREKNVLLLVCVLHECISVYENNWVYRKKLVLAGKSRSNINVTGAHVCSYLDYS